MTPKATDPMVWNPKWTLMQKLRRLKAIDPEVLRAVEMFVDDALQRLGQANLLPTKAMCCSAQPLAVTRINE